MTKAARCGDPDPTCPAEKAAQIHTLLLAAYGRPQRERSDPLAELIGTVLSANTSDVNSGRAFRALMERFDGDWDSIRRAPLAEIKAAIRPAGIYQQKAPSIVAILERLWREEGAYTLEQVTDLDVAAGLAYLTSFPGVGHKTASIVLLFAFGKGAFPVDTHVQRISQRLGISGAKASPAAIKQIWESLLPAESYLALHLNLIRHGRQVCLARSPRCAECVLQPCCDYVNRSGEWQEIKRNSPDSPSSRR